MLGLLGDKKKIASMVVGSKFDVKDDKLSSEKGVEMEYDETFQMIADELLGAIEKKDKNAFISAFKAMCYKCEGEKEGEEPSVEIEVK